MNIIERQIRLGKWMDLLTDEFVALLTDHDTYWKTQTVIKSNPHLMNMHSPFFDLLNDSYVYS
ncbi:MAG: hypothetical protein M3O09_12520, partial [Acidobacteriota bacterium]|nr:hypothetical protein [Acidobacteriota bacterium]